MSTYPEVHHQSPLRKLASYIQLHHPSRPKLLIWAGCIVLLTVLAVRDFLPLLDDYTRNNMATQVAVKATPIPPPALTVCMPHHSRSLYTIADFINLKISGNKFVKCLECEALQNRSLDVWSNASQFNTSVKFTTKSLVNILTDLLIEKILAYENITNILTLQRSNFNWNQPLVDAVTKVLACIGLTDYELVYGKFLVAYLECSGLNLTRIWLLPPKKLNQLHQLVVDGVSVYLEGLAPKSPMRQPGATFNGDTFCFPIPENATLAKNNYTLMYRFFGNEYNVTPPWMRANRTNGFELWEDDTVLYQRVNYQDNPLYRTAKEDLRIVHEIPTFYYSVGTRVVGWHDGRDCNADAASVAKCISSKQVQEILNVCKCVPFCYRHLVPETDFPYCNVTMAVYTECRALRTKFPQQTKECENRCQYTFYKWRSQSVQIVEPYPPNQPRWEFQIQLYAENTPYVEFSMVPKNTPEQFLSQIGGLVNLFLGFSGLSFCTFVIFFLDIVQEWYRKRDVEHNNDHDQTMRMAANIVKIESELAQLRQDVQEVKQALQEVRADMSKIDDTVEDVE